MKRFLFFTLSCFFILNIFPQNANKLALEINYGLNGNFFVVNADYGQSGGPSSVKFYQKNFIGPIAGIELKYNLTKISRIGIAFANSRNSKQINYTSNTINVGIRDWQITHTNKIFQLYYERDLGKQKNNFKYHAGLFYLRSNQQEVDIGDYPNGGVIFDERNFKNSNLEEGGIFVGFHYSKKIDTKFDLGIKSRIYFLISTNNFEAITLTPTLTYHF